MKIRLVLWIERMAEKHRRFYMTLVVVLASLGYLFLLSLLLIPVIAIPALYSLISESATIEQWVLVGILSLLAVCCLFMSVRLFQFKFNRVRGIKISRDLAPDLYEMIDEVKGHYKRTTLKTVVISDCVDVFIESVPRSGFPFVFSNHLVIGLPIMQTLSAEELHCQLSRCIGQYSGIMPRTLLFIFKSAKLWDLFSRSLNKNKFTGSLLLRWFFSAYAPFFSAIATPAIRNAEMEAELCALDFINEKDVFDALKARAVSKVYFEQYYWPNVRKMALKNTGALIKPFWNLEKVVHSALSQGSRNKWLSEAYEKKQLPGEVLPSLRQSMEYMGHTRLRSVPGLSETASEKLLGEARKKVIPVIDKLWCSDTHVKWVKQYKEQCRDIETLKGLSRKSHQAILWPKEIMAYARLEKKLRGNSVKSSIRKILRRNIKNSLPDFVRTRTHSAERLNDIF